MSDDHKEGRVRVVDFGTAHSAKWRVVGDLIEITSKYGVATTPIGVQRVSPAIVAHEKFRDVVKAANRVEKIPATDKSRFNIRDA